jgi:glycosyltransferase involved in cell wall biosynthesis
VRAYTPEWFECWREADVLAMPTTGEAFGMVFQEAGAAGLPSIGTRLNAIPEIVTHDETGLLVNRGDVPGLAAALRRLARSADLRRTMGTAARAHVEATCSPQAYGDRLVELLYQVTGAQRVHNE